MSITSQMIKLILRLISKWWIIVNSKVIQQIAIGWFIASYEKQKYLESQSFVWNIAITLKGSLLFSSFGYIK